MTVPHEHRLRQLADVLAHSGELTADWREAFCAAPRHVMVPRYYEQDDSGQWHLVDGAERSVHQQWLDAVYSDRTLITALLDHQGPWGVQQVPVSSATQPGLMMRMLDELDVDDGHRVLEIGTGTGYNAAILSARLGDDNVYSIDLRPDLVTAARESLTSLGHHPTLVTGDGAQGLPDGAPYDRIIATCAVRCIPRAWVAQLAPGGVLLADIKGSINAGNIVKLQKPCDADLVQGNFLPWWAGFMTMAHDDSPPHASQPLETDDGDITHRSSALGPEALDNPVLAFLAQAHLPADVELRQRLIGDQWATVLRTRSGSWCSVEPRADATSRYQIQEGGPTRLWEFVEAAYRQWSDIGNPTWDRFGITVTDHDQRIWLDRPEGQYTWTMQSPPLTSEGARP